MIEYMTYEYFSQQVINAWNRLPDKFVKRDVASLKNAIVLLGKPPSG